jgi:hypothetical protein
MRTADGCGKEAPAVPLKPQAKVVERGIPVIAKRLMADASDPGLGKDGAPIRMTEIASMLLAMVRP